MAPYVTNLRLQIVALSMTGTVACAPISVTSKLAKSKESLPLSLSLERLALRDDRLLFWMIIENTGDEVLQFSDPSGYSYDATEPTLKWHYGESISTASSCSAENRQHKLFPRERLFLPGDIRVGADARKIELHVGLPVTEMDDNWNCSLDYDHYTYLKAKAVFDLGNSR